MKYFALLLLVALVHCEEDYVLKTRIDAAQQFRACLSTLGITREEFKNINWSVDSDNPKVQSTIKCVVENFGLFDDTKGFNRDLMVKQFGGETVRARIEKCIDNYPIGEANVDQSVQKVMNCLEEDNLKMYGDKPESESQNKSKGEN